MPHPILLKFDVGNLPEVRSIYDRMRVYRAAVSKDSSTLYGEDTYAYDSTPYNTTELGWTELTDREQGAAGVLISLAGPFPLSGTNLHLVIDRTSTAYISFDKTYTAGALLTFLSQILEDFLDVDLTDEGILLSSRQGGMGGRVELSGTAMPLLGLPDIVKVTGLESWIYLDNHNRIYQFKDLDGESWYWYCYTLYNYISGVESEKLGIQSGGPIPQLDSSQLSTCSGQILDGGGSGVSQAMIIFYPASGETTIQGAFVIPKPITSMTDPNGRFSIDLIRGMIYTAVVSGTSIARKITVPDAASFDLFDALASTEDPFTIQVPDERQWLIRRS